MTAEQADRIGNEAIDGFLLEWRKSPWAWAQEIDVHADLIQRIKGEIPAPDQLLQAGHCQIKGGGVRMFSRATCTPVVARAPGYEKIYPDIVIWGAGDKADQGTSDISDGQWPILWVCEIKYDFTSPATGERDDYERLSQLITSGRAERATQLILVLNDNRSVADDDIVPSVDGMLVRREFWVPPGRSTT